MDNKRILIVEDQTDARELFVIFFRRTGYDVIEARSGLEAIAQARATLPNLIVMDLGLPGIPGDEATARLKADPATSHIPVVVSTAFHNGSPVVQRAIAAGAAEILHKPISFVVLKEMALRYAPMNEPSVAHCVQPHPAQSSDSHAAG